MSTYTQAISIRSVELIDPESHPMSKLPRHYVNGSIEFICSTFWLKCPVCNKIESAPVPEHCMVLCPRCIEHATMQKMSDVELRVCEAIDREEWKTRDALSKKLSERYATDFAEIAELNALIRSPDIGCVYKYGLQDQIRDKNFLLGERIRPFEHLLEGRIKTEMLEIELVLTNMKKVNDELKTPDLKSCGYVFVYPETHFSTECEWKMTD